MAKKEPKDSKNWRLLNRRKNSETLQNRDVYDTQQMERGLLGNKQTFTVRHIMAVSAGILVLSAVWMFYSIYDVGVLQKKADEEAARVKPITENAPEEPRNLNPVQWLNLTLVGNDRYKKFGYLYADYATKSYYTQAEYEIWRDINAEFDSRSDTDDYYPEIWRYSDGGDFYYAERPHIADSPAEPRSFSLAEYANMKVEPCHSEEDPPMGRHCYHDKGYFYKDYTYERYLTQAEYGKWREVQKNLEQLTESGEIIHYKDLETGQALYNDETHPYLTPADVDGLNREAVTEDAGERVTTPIALADIVWANMDLGPGTRYTKFRYKYADRRTGKYYTESEYAVWSNIQSKIANRTEGYIYWREKNTEYGGYNYYTEPPEYAPSEERDVFKAFTDLRLMTLNLVPGERWKEWGYTYADSNTASYCTDSEYQRWKEVQDRVASGELGVPDTVADYIRTGGLTVTDVILGAMPVPPEKMGMNDGVSHFHFAKLFLSLILGAATYGILREILKRNLKAQNMMEDTSDINQYDNDQHIALPEEIQRKFDWFPDAGAHSPVTVSSMVSHMMLTNKGLNSVQFAERAKEDIYGADGNLEYYKGEILLDADGNPITVSVPMIDEEFGDALFETSGNPKEVCKKYSTVKIPYNPGGKNRSKQAGKWDTVAEMINNEWQLPLYEPQRPAGAYMVDTEPVNTMVLAMTRAGKGQGVIEPTIDMWTRELRPNNMVINDPKGELLVKNYVRGTVRGFNIVQFNLINAMKTDIYNRATC